MATGTPESRASTYTKPAAYLQQGDLFRLPIVLPYADFAVRLFRGIGGEHGQDVLGSEGDIEFEVMSESDLELRLSSSRSLGPGPVSAFGRDGSRRELVVVEAERQQLFIIASQTCDISGVDKGCLPGCVVLPVTSLASFCRDVSVPFQVEGQQTVSTIETFLAERAGAGWLRNEADEDYHTALQLALEEWVPEKALRATKGAIVNAVNREMERGNLFWLRESSEPRMPACGADLTAMFTIATAALNRALQDRIGTLADVYRERFSRAVGDRLSRVATDQPLAPGKFRA